MPTRVSRPSPAPLAAELLQAWAEIPTTVASDVSRGRLLVDPRIRPLRPNEGNNAPLLLEARHAPGLALQGAFEKDREAVPVTRR